VCILQVRNPSNATEGANVSIVASIPSTAPDALGVNPNPNSSPKTQPSKPSTLNPYPNSTPKTQPAECKPETPKTQVVRQGVYDSPVLEAGVSHPVEARLSVDDMAFPLRVFLPFFHTSLVGQSYPLISASNLLSVTLQANCDVAPESTLTLSGLVETQTASTALAVTSAPANAFASGAGVWTQTNGALVLTPNP